MDDNDKSLDVLGIKPLTQATQVVTTSVVNGVGAFLSRICLPAAEEFGLFLQDHVKAWRSKNATDVLIKAEQMLSVNDNQSLKAHPRIVGKIIETSSWFDDTEVQSLWAGLLAASCSIDGNEQSNLIFVNLLSQFTQRQAKILKYTCETAQKVLSVSGLVLGEAFEVKAEEMYEIAHTNDKFTLDLELDHMRELGIFDSDSGFLTTADIVRIHISGIGLQLYAKCQGFPGTPIDFYKL